MMGECRSVIGLFLLFTLHLSQAAVKVQQQTVVGLVRQGSSMATIITQNETEYTLTEQSLR